MGKINRNAICQNCHHWEAFECLGDHTLADCTLLPEYMPVTHDHSCGQHPYRFSPSFGSDIPAIFLKARKLTPRAAFEMTLRRRDGETLASLAAEYGLDHTGVLHWERKYEESLTDGVLENAPSFQGVK